MERSKYNRSGGGAGRGRGAGRSVSGGGRGGSGERAGNNYQQYQTGGDGGRRGGRGGRDGTHMGPNPSPAQPWGYQRGQGRIQRPQFAMGRRAAATGGTGVWSGGPRHVAGSGSSAPAVGGGAGAGQAPRRILSLFVFLKLIYHLCSPLLHALSIYALPLLFTMLPLLPIGDEWRCSLLQLQHQLLSHHHRIHLQLHWTISSTGANLLSYLH